ncbi:hypothetical protein J2Y03_002685 [Neobacillus niacini]|nr:hypothetical protein [Neobacillus niacini]
MNELDSSQSDFPVGAAGSHWNATMFTTMETK